MKKIILTLTVILVATALRAQVKSSQVGVFVNLHYATRIWSEPEFIEFKKDSVNKMDKGLAGFSGGINWIVNLNKKMILQTGIQYYNAGFVRRFENVQFGDSVHPEIPKFPDFFEGDPRHIHLHYQYRYIQVPVILNYELIRMRKSISLHYFLTPGLTFGYLVNDDIKIKTLGFAIDGNTTGYLANTYQSNKFNVQLTLGARIEYWLDHRYRLQVQPLLNIPLMSALKGDQRAWIFSAGINVGVSIPLDKLRTGGE